MIRRLFLAALIKVTEVLSGKGLGTIPLVKKIHYFLLQQLIPNEVEVQGHKLYINRSVINHERLTTGTYEKKTTDLFKKVVERGMVVVDIGANIGYYTLIAAMLVGEEGKVIAFEPDPDNYALLMKTINANRFKNIFPIQKAVLNKSGKVRLFIDPKDKEDSSLIRANVPNPVSSIIVEATTLDECLQTLGIDRVDIIKMDTQGAEGLILEGMSEIIKKSNRLKIIAEFWPTGLKNFGSAPVEVLNKFKDFGFQYKIIDEQKQCIESITINELMLNYCDKGYTNLFLEKALHRK